MTTDTEPDIVAVGEFSSLFGVTMRALRLYEEQGLLPLARVKGGRRLYSIKRDGERLRRILILKKCGLSIREIRELPVQRFNNGCLLPPSMIQEHKKILEDQQQQIAEGLDLLRGMEAEHKGN
jgi:DNA-binding transcriptional MerR regulator